MTAVYYVVLFLVGFAWVVATLWVVDSIRLERRRLRRIRDRREWNAHWNRQVGA